MGEGRTVAPRCNLARPKGERHALPRACLPALRRVVRFVALCVLWDLQRFYMAAVKRIMVTMWFTKVPVLLVDELERDMQHRSGTGALPALFRKPAAPAGIAAPYYYKVHHETDVVEGCYRECRLSVGLFSTSDFAQADLLHALDQVADGRMRAFWDETRTKACSTTSTRPGWPDVEAANIASCRRILVTIGLKHVPVYLAEELRRELQHRLEAGILSQLFNKPAPPSTARPPAAFYSVTPDGFAEDGRYRHVKLVVGLTSPTDFMPADVRHALTEVLECRLLHCWERSQNRSTHTSDNELSWEEIEARLSVTF
jgi:hypothetical protein